MTSDERQRILSAQQNFGLRSEASVEKDYFVVRAMQAIVGADTGPFTLVFGGGTCVARAHRLTKRMSEDIDFKIVPKPGNEGMKGSALKRELSALKYRVATALSAAGFEFDPQNRDQVRSQNQNQYSIFQLPYNGQFSIAEGLRATIQIELKLDPLLLPPIELSVASFVAEAFKEAVEIPKIPCVSLTEIAVEKFVALTRRTSMEVAGLAREHDQTLVRHLYDLHFLRHTMQDIRFGTLVAQVMNQDAQAFGNQYPAYRDDHIGQTQAAMDALAENPVYAQRYADFVGAMVYGEVPPFIDCIATLREFLLVVNSNTAPL